MRLTICAVGRMRAGPGRVLLDDYLDRAAKSGRGLGLGPFDMAEIDDRKGGGPAAEAALLDRAAPDGARRIALDERGRLMTSPDFADRLAQWRDEGARDVALFIGGADGLDPALRDAADLTLSLGPMVWPHMLARVMLAEQLYRATQILAGTPYHRI
jgi:23S rRNA (pseudouridine1915-N3)-methyltransferase